MEKNMPETNKPRPRILIDADGCPVVDEALRIARQFGAECILLCDTSHEYERESARTMVFAKGADSVDFGLISIVRPGDIVVTQDYGLAAMCLARSARVLDQNGMEYTSSNIDGLLDARHFAKKVRRGGGRLKGPSKRTPEQDKAFVLTLIRMLEDG
jgi:uncharacterized protein YaiI (UPF0178 family)